MNTRVRDTSLLDGFHADTPRTPWSTPVQHGWQSVVRRSAMAITSTVCILAVGNLLGAVIKGVTGFGSAIILLCVWVSAVHLGLPAGTLQQAVLSECVTGWVLALPLLFVTRAHRTWDWRLVLSLGTFEAAGAPLGAALLAHLNPRYVELCMACLLLALIGLQCHTAGYLRAASQAINRLLYRQGQAYEHMPAEEAVPGANMVKLQQLGDIQPCTGAAPKDLIKPHEPGVQPPAQLLCEAALCSSRSSSPCSSVSRGSEPADGTQPSDDTDSRTEERVQQQCRVGQEPQLAMTASRLSSCATGSGGHGLVVVHAAAKGGAPAAGAAPANPHSCSSSPSNSQKAALLPKGCTDSSHQDTHPCIQQQHCGGSPGSKKQQQEQEDAAGSARAVRWGPGQYSSWREWWAAMQEPQQLATNLRVLGLAAVAGTSAGVMAGMTGMGGPPLMFMFSVLRIPKEVVRGTNAVLNVLQWRILAYLSMGSFVREDTNLYIACAAAGVVGMAGGSVLAQRVNQEAFSRVLLLLMCLCCVLMFVAAAGWG